MRPESRRLHNFRHFEKYTLHPGDDVFNKRWRHGNWIIEATTDNVSQVHRPRPHCRHVRSIRTESISASWINVAPSVDQETHMPIIIMEYYLVFAHGI